MIKNTIENYGSIAKWLHWIIAILFLGAYCAVYYRHWFTERQTPENLIALHLHLSIGITIGVLVILRIIWRLNNTQPLPEPGAPLQHRLIKLGHYTLYAVMIIAPLTGYMGTGTNANYFFMFEIPKFENTWLFSMLIENGMGLSFKEFEKPIDFIHKDILGELVVWILIVGHTLAALYHHFVRKDRTLIKMTTGK